MLRSDSARPQRMMKWGRIAQSDTFNQINTIREEEASNPSRQGSIDRSGLSTMTGTPADPPEGSKEEKKPEAEEKKEAEAEKEEDADDEDDIEEDEIDDDVITRAKMEEDLAPQVSKFVLDPDGQFIYQWTGVVTLAVIYNAWIIILRIAFPEMREDPLNQLVFFYCDYASDLVYLADIILQFRLGFLENGILVLDPVKLSRNYRRQPEFLRDLGAILPAGTLATSLAHLTDSAIMDIGEVDESDIYIPIVRLTRLLKLHTMFKFFEVTDSRTSSPNGVRALKLTLYLSVLIHSIACFYYMMSAFQGLGSDDWVFPGGENELQFSSKYIRSLYWATVTLTTIGGMSSPVTTKEYVFTGVTFLIGVFVFAAVVGNVGDVISNMNASRQDFTSRMDQIKFYMGHRRVPEFLQDRVKRWADYSWSRTQAIDEAVLLEMLPERLRSEIAIHIHLDTLKKVKIFEECEEGLLHELVLKLRSQIYSPLDFICRTGEIGREMYIINHGKVEILVNNSSAPGGKMVVATLSEGNYFGEISLLKLDSGQNKRTADVRSVGYSELLCLSRKDLMTALVEYPDAKKILEAQARERMEKNKEVRRTNTVESTGSTKPADPPSGSSSKPDTPTKIPFLGRKQSSLFNILKSEDFKQMMGMGGKAPDMNKELAQIKLAMTEARNYEQQVTKQRLHQLAERCENLHGTIRQRDDQLKLALVRMAQLEETFRSRRKRKGWNKKTSGDPQRYDKLIQEIENRMNKDTLTVPGICINDDDVIDPVIEIREPTPESGGRELDWGDSFGSDEQEGFLGIDDDRSIASSIFNTDTSRDSVESEVSD